MVVSTVGVCMMENVSYTSLLTRDVVPYVPVTHMIIFKEESHVYMFVILLNLFSLL